MRPFLGALWAVLATTNDGSNLRTRNVVHTRRIRHALEWIRAVLEGKQTPLARTLRAFRPASGVIILTDASTWGLGAVVLERGEPKEFSSCPIPPEFILRTGAIPGIPKHMTLGSIVPTFSRSDVAHQTPDWVSGTCQGRQHWRPLHHCKGQGQLPRTVDGRQGDSTGPSEREIRVHHTPTHQHQAEQDCRPSQSTT